MPTSIRLDRWRSPRPESVLLGARRFPGGRRERIWKPGRARRTVNGEARQIDAEHGAEPIRVVLVSRGIQVEGDAPGCAGKDERSAA